MSVPLKNANKLNLKVQSHLTLTQEDISWCYSYMNCGTQSGLQSTIRQGRCGMGYFYGKPTTRILVICIHLPQYEKNSILPAYGVGRHDNS